MSTITVNIPLEELTERGYASYFELDKVRSIKKTIDRGVNEWGFKDKTIVDINGRHWDYIPEDQIYELVEQGKERDVAITHYGY